jgi:hypothetical protein
MDLRMVTQRAAPVLAGVALFVFLVTAAAGPAAAAPRMGITRARGLPAESSVRPAGVTTATHPLTAASVTAPVAQREDYFVTPWGVSWAIGAVGALLLLAGARSYALARRRALPVEPVEHLDRRPPADERRKAA